MRQEPLGRSKDKLILCENYRPHTKNKIFFFLNNNNKKKPAYLQDNNIFYESGLPKFPVNLCLLQFFSVTDLLRVSFQSV